jgi:hypothetical protein
MKAAPKGVWPWGADVFAAIFCKKTAARKRLQENGRFLVSGIFRASTPALARWLRPRSRQAPRGLEPGDILWNRLAIPQNVIAL